MGRCGDRDFLGPMYAFDAAGFREEVGMQSQQGISPLGHAMWLQAMCLNTVFDDLSNWHIFEKCKEPRFVFQSPDPPKFRLWLKLVETIRFESTPIYTSLLQFQAFTFPQSQSQNWVVVGPPLWKIWLRQLGWWHSLYIWEFIKHGNQSPPTRKRWSTSGSCTRWPLFWPGDGPSCMKQNHENSAGSRDWNIIYWILSIFI